MKLLRGVCAAATTAGTVYVAFWLGFNIRWIYEALTEALQ